MKCRLLWMIAAVLRRSTALCPGTGTLTSGSGSLTGPTSYTANDKCTWILEPANVADVTVSLDAGSLLVPGDTISIFQCPSPSCAAGSLSLLTTCTSSSYFCIATSNGQNPIVMVQFQGGSSGSASVFTMTYSSDPTLYCAENNCNSHCSARTANACNNLTSCQLQQPSSSSSQPVTCLCVWNYKNSANSQASDMSQPDYQTNGGCVDLGTEVDTAIATAFAIGTGILVRSRRIFAGFKIGLVNLMWAGRDHRHPNHRHSHPHRDLRHVLLPVGKPPSRPPCGVRYRQRCLATQPLQFVSPPQPRLSAALDRT